MPNTCVEDEVSMNNASNQQYNLGASLIPYSKSKLANPNFWNSNFNPISIFRTIKKSMNNVKNVIVSLNHMSFFIDKRDIKNNREIDLSYLEDFSQVAWISAISRESEQFPAIMHKEKYKNEITMLICQYLANKYYSLQWQRVIIVVLKKPNKSDYTQTKAYYFITLLEYRQAT